MESHGGLNLTCVRGSARLRRHFSCALKNPKELALEEGPRQLTQQMQRLGDRSEPDVPTEWKKVHVAGA